VAEELKVWSEQQDPKEIPVKGKDGVVRRYFIREMDGEGLEQWTASFGNRIKTNSRGKIIKRDMKGFHSELIALCLHDESGNRVPRSVIDGFGTALKNYLFDECQKINGLTRDDEGEEGKD
jgi:hypothetical protein